VTFCVEREWLGLYGASYTRGSRLASPHCAMLVVKKER
jgi:hypothetical protein